MKKEDCIDHVAKRMYSGLDALKKAKKGFGGKGELTNVKMRSLKDNAPDVVAMQQGVFASPLHSYSTDAEPRHIVCPTRNGLLVPLEPRQGTRGCKRATWIQAPQASLFQGDCERVNSPLQSTFMNGLAGVLLEDEDSKCK